MRLRRPCNSKILIYFLIAIWHLAVERSPPSEQPPPNTVQIRMPGDHPTHTSEQSGVEQSRHVGPRSPSLWLVPRPLEWAPNSSRAPPKSGLIAYHVAHQHLLSRPLLVVFALPLLLFTSAHFCFFRQNHHTPKKLPCIGGGCCCCCSAANCCCGCDCWFCCCIPKYGVPPCELLKDDAVVS